MDDNKDRKLFTEFPPITAEQWKNKVVEDLKGADFEKKLVWKPEIGLSFQPFYVADDLAELDYLNSNPGEFPFNRGNKIHDNNWKIIQHIENMDHSEANKTALDAIKRGAEGIIFSAEGINAVQNLEFLLEGINPEKTALCFFGINASSDFIANYQSFCIQKGYNTGNISGYFDFDPLGKFVVEGEFATNQDTSITEAGEMIKRTSETFPKMKALNIRGDNFHNAGASIIQELAYTLACGNEYLELLTDKNIGIDSILGKIQFTMAVGSSYFLEIAKLRAARILWAKIANEYNPLEINSGKVNINVVVSTYNKTVYDPYVNLLRSTTEAMSAAIGCCDSMTIAPFNSYYKVNDAFADRIARNQQIILKEESYFGKVTDPSAGSYYIENLTDSIAKHAWDLFVQIQEKGGFIKFVESGELKAEIEKTSKQRDMDIASRKTSVLGTNTYPNSNEMMLAEIGNVSKSEGKGLRLYRGAQAFEDLRLSTEKRFIKDGFRPKVMLLTYGNLAMRKARATFSANFLGCAGYEITPEYNFESVEKSIAEIEKRDANIIVICSSDEEYASTAPEIAKVIKEKFNNKIVIIAGSPKELIDILKSSGVDEFIHVRSNALDVLRCFNLKMGIV
jgi:methylmalonyl-CoA mutase